jgi:hypothetical protein
MPRRESQAATAVAAVAAFVPPPAPVVAETAPIVNHRNFMNMSGEQLRSYAHRAGISKSEMDRLDDDRLKVQVRYAIARQQDEE